MSTSSVPTGRRRSPISTLPLLTNPVVAVVAVVEEDVVAVVLDLIVVIVTVPAVVDLVAEAEVEVDPVEGARRSSTSRMT